MIASNNTIIRARINSDQKAKAERVLHRAGWNMSAFLRVMVCSVAETGEIPAIPNAATAKAIRAAQKPGVMKSAGKTPEGIRQALWG